MNSAPLQNHQRFSSQRMPRFYRWPSGDAMGNNAKGAFPFLRRVFSITMIPSQLITFLDHF